MAALEPLRRVSYTVHVVALGQFWGKVRGDTRVDQEVFFLYAKQHPPPEWEM